MTMNLALALHMLGVVVWVGGMFFAYMALRPAAVEVLQAPFRLRLWEAVFSKFFPWVWLSIILILASGYYIIFALIGGFGSTGLYVHIMHGLGIVMLFIFLHVYFAPFNRLKKSNATESWEPGGKALGQIRVLIGINLAIGLITIIVATAGKNFLT
ncbi:MAG: CopD family protein [Thiotrichaceae bacterium]